MIFGIGNDIIEVKRIEHSLNSIASFKEKIFSQNEIKYCDSQANPILSYAVRFAGKEAFLKAIGTGWRNGIKFNEIEITNDDLGKPYIKLYGKAKEIFNNTEGSNIYISLSHIKEFAMATVIIEK